ncbi:unnamed protein product, partial [Mesorhabditis spiculigera]
MRLLAVLPVLWAGAWALFPFGISQGDTPLSDAEWLTATVDIPVVYYARPQTQAHISRLGLLIFGDQPQPDHFRNLEHLNKSAVAAFYAPTSGGSVFLRSTSSDKNLLMRLSSDVIQVFPEKDFNAKQAVVATWENMANLERQSGNTFQLVLVSDGIDSFAIFVYKAIAWASSNGHFAQAGFSHPDGWQLNVNSGTDTLKDLMSLSNSDRDGQFIYKISGLALEHPKGDDEYSYSDEYEGEDGESRKGGRRGEDCPPDPYKDKCPAGCSVITDTNGCSRCLCAERPPPQLPQGNDLEEEQPEPAVSKEEENSDVPEEDLHPLDPRVTGRHRLTTPAINRVPIEGGNSVTEEISACQAAGCHPNAGCRDYPGGVCCQCNTDYYGNGKDCVKRGEVQRLVGSFEGALNGQRVDKSEIHVYVANSDGHAYSAISRLPQDQNLGTSMLLLLPVGSVIGWLFAEVNSPSLYNGFELTGGIFNRTATVHIGDTAVVTIRQQFTGRNRQDYLIANTFVTGTLPQLRDGADVTFPDYDEEYRVEKPGFVRSYSTLEAVVNEGGTKRKFKLTVDQQMHFEECAFKPNDRTNAAVLNVKRAHVTYDKVDGIVRYASRNYVDAQRTTTKEENVQAPREPATGDVQPESRAQDVCATGKHVCTHPHMLCRPVEHSYRCECAAGYQAKHDSTSSIGWYCVDIDECARGDSTCDPNAACLNTDGGFQCQCNAGFSGDGHRCFGGELRGDEQQPHPRHHAQGHDGHPAEMAPQAPGSCAAHTDCHQWGECVFPEGAAHGQCKCRGWYVGDGVEHCGPPQETRRAPQQPAQHPPREEHQPARMPSHQGLPCGSQHCSAHAECLPSTDGGSECVCRAGYNGNGLQCESLLAEEGADQPVQVGASGTICRSHDECSEHGSCAYDQSVGYYQCICTPPYTGDGVRCTAEGGGEVLVPYNNAQHGSGGQECDVLRNCGQNADCVFARPHWKCACQSGFIGDGYHCVEAALGLPDLLPPLEPPTANRNTGCDRCDTNAQCVFDSHNRRFVCECVSGYMGDGLSCVQVAGQGHGGHGGRLAAPKLCREQSDCHQSAHCVQNDRNEYFCQCLPGFRGDGVTTCRIADKCTPADPNSCAQNAQCQYREDQGAYLCVCVEGFTGDGTSCVPHAQPVGCDRDPKTCHHNAQCVYNHERREYGCLCKPGTHGDGRSRCDQIETPQCSGCSIHAQCVLTAGGASRCQCSNGYVGNGHVCQPMTTCLDDRAMCSEHAECVPGEGGHYICNCRYGFHGNGRICTADSDSRTDTLLVARGMAIFHRGTNQDIPGKQLVVIPHHIAVGVDFDCQEERIVWSDISGHSIRSASLQGGNMSSHFTDTLESPEGIAVDWSSRNIYYADSLKDEIGVVSMDGKYQKALVTEGLVNPRALAIDLQNRHLFYTDWHRQSPIIGRVDLDGRNNHKFVQDDIHLPNGLTILPNRRELCWVDAGVKRLSCIGLDGRNRRTVYSNLNYPFGVTHVREERFYWTDWKDNRVHTVDIYGSAYQSMPISLGGSGKSYGILGVPDKCVGGVTACATENGGCPYLCLPTAAGPTSKTCVCPDNDDTLQGC